MSIRDALPSDIPELVRMGSRSLKEGPYSGEIDNPEQSARLALDVMNQSNGKILIAEDDEGKSAGLLGFILYPHYFTGRLMAIEIMWWVEPEYRSSMIGIVLVRAAQRIAKTMGAVVMQFTAPSATPQVGKAYEAMGYRKMEEAYQRDL